MEMQIPTKLGWHAKSNLVKASQHICMKRPHLWSHRLIGNLSIQSYICLELFVLYDPIVWLYNMLTQCPNWMWHKKASMRKSVQLHSLFFFLFFFIWMAWLAVSNAVLLSAAPILLIPVACIKDAASLTWHRGWTFFWRKQPSHCWIYCLLLSVKKHLNVTMMNVTYKLTDRHMDISQLIATGFVYMPLQKYIFKVFIVSKKHQMLHNVIADSQRVKCITKFEIATYFPSDYFYMN